MTWDIDNSTFASYGSSRYTFPPNVYKPNTTQIYDFDSLKTIANAMNWGGLIAGLMILEKEAPFIFGKEERNPKVLFPNRQDDIQTTRPISRTVDRTTWLFVRPLIKSIGWISMNSSTTVHHLKIVQAQLCLLGRLNGVNSLLSAICF